MPDGMSEAALSTMRRAMCLTMLADGRVVRRESEFLTARWQEMSGSVLDVPAFEAEADAVIRDPEASWAWLKAQAAQLSESEKRAIVRGAVHMLIADAQFCEREIYALHRIARALVFPDLKRVMNEVWRESQR